MPVTSGAQHVWVYADSIIANQYSQMSRGILELDLNLVRLRVAKRVCQCLTTYSISFIANNRVQRPRRSFHDHTAIFWLFTAELLSSACERSLEIVCVTGG